MYIHVCIYSADAGKCIFGVIGYFLSHVTCYIAHTRHIKMFAESTEQSDHRDSTSGDRHVTTMAVIVK